MKFPFVRTSILSAILFGSAVPLLGAAEAEPEPELISRAVLFSHAERSNVQVSPDGSHLSWIAPLNGVLNIWVAPLERPDLAKAVTKDDARGIRSYMWTHRANTILYVRDSGGDENYHVYSADTTTGTTRNLTPYPGASAAINHVSPLHPGSVLLEINDRDRRYRDLYRVDLLSGQRTLVLQNREFSGLLTDSDFKVRVAIRPDAQGGYEQLEPDGHGAWKLFDTIPNEDSNSSWSIRFSGDGRTRYSFDSRGRDTAGLYATDTASGDRTLLVESADADVNRVLVNPRTGRIRAAAMNHTREKWIPIEEGFSVDLAELRKLGAGNVSIHSQSLDDRVWIVSYAAAEQPRTYHRYDRDGAGPGRLTKLFDSYPDMVGKPWVPMHPVKIPARDGLSLVSYLTLPKKADGDHDGRADKPVPMVLLVHGGPWDRDEYGFDPTHQWLANRGYAVLSVNYRGSTGFGKDFLNKADGEFAGKMHEDLLDAVDWAVGNGVTTKDKVAIMGGSYGGYATLVGLTFTPDVFRCGVDIVGPSNLVTLIESFPASWGPHLQSTWYKRVGDPRTEDGRKALLARSPVSRVDAISRPLLIGHGSNDSRVLQSESDTMVAAMQRRGLPVTYALFPDEGHGFHRPQNAKAFNAITEGFLGRCLGGRVEPIGNDIEGSSLQVPAGAEQIEGLIDALKAHRAELRM